MSSGAEQPGQATKGILKPKHEINDQRSFTTATLDSFLVVKSGRGCQRNPRTNTTINRPLCETTFMFN
uniref:Uncharacterized protein n=1 Tax=Mesocestoides corti TaxID=53468 RepID=A0A5K3F8I6_MESCO